MRTILNFLTLTSLMLFSLPAMAQGRGPWGFDRGSIQLEGSFGLNGSRGEDADNLNIDGGLGFWVTGLYNIGPVGFGASYHYSYQYPKEDTPHEALNARYTMQAFNLEARGRIRLLSWCYLFGFVQVGIVTGKMDTSLVILGTEYKSTDEISGVDAAAGGGIMFEVSPNLGFHISGKYVAPKWNEHCTGSGSTETCEVYDISFWHVGLGATLTSPTRS